jgi:hypothetical protein
MTDFKRSCPKRTQPKTRYRVRNWAEHDRALVARGSVAPWFEDGTLARQWNAAPTGKRRAQPEYSAPAIQIMLTLKAVFGLTNRSVEGFVRSLWARLRIAAMNIMTRLGMSVSAPAVHSI